ncbi:MAG: potassium-transporting ATPase subunit F [Acidimicrobiia bacterium]|jgi:K+-transporting ATPase KdpF subunit|nr:potassium-transporting ATPase subunit F [Acidimicrobiia bacterium]
MSLADVISLAVAAGLLVFVVLALIFPERF